MSFVGNRVSSSNWWSKVPNYPYTRLDENFASLPSLVHMSFCCQLLYELSDIATFWNNLQG